MSALRSEGGSAAAEITLVTPALFLLLLFAVLAGRVAQAENDVQGAAADAARAASIQRSASGARADARSTAQRSLAHRGVTCSRLDVRADTSGLRPGGQVAVAVSCTVDLRDLSLLAVPGSRTVGAEAVEVIDVYRGE